MNNRALVASLALALCFPAVAKTSGKSQAIFGSGSSAAPAGGHAGTAMAGGGAHRLHRPNLRKAPELDPQRKVNEQDCSKPVDLLAGNLRCK